MEFKQLKYFLQTARSGSIFKAANELGMSQPALSRLLSSFEGDVGVVLFARSTKGVVLTDAGNRLVEHAEIILGAVERARSDIQDVKLVPTGKVRLGMPPSANSVLLQPLMAAYRGAYPQVSLHVVEAFSGHICDFVRSKEIDIGVIYHEPQSADFVVEKLITEELFLVCPADSELDDEVDIAELSHLDMILPHPQDGLRVLLERSAELAGVSINVVCEIDSCNATLPMVAGGLGYSVMPYAFVANEVARGAVRAVRLGRPQLERDVFLVSLANAPMRLSARELARHVRQQSVKLVRDGIWSGGHVIGGLQAAATA